jgi:hypothetical protein
MDEVNQIVSLVLKILIEQEELRLHPRYPLQSRFNAPTLLR